MNATTKPYRRGSQTVRPFSAREDELITKWRVAGWGTTEIAIKLHAETGILRSQATINMRLKTLAKLEDTEC
jgi:hypothetical protein